MQNRGTSPNTVIFINRIRKMKDAKKSRIPIIAMTANAFAEDIQKVLSVGMNAHVAKPVDMNILVPTMMKCLKE